MPRDLTGRGTARGEAAIRAAYEREGPEEFYRRHGRDYRNPHEHLVRAILVQAVATWTLDLSRVLDLACGSGEVTMALREFGAVVEGVDPFTGDAYLARTGIAAQPLSFEQVAWGGLTGQRFSLVVCSFALHLLEESRLPALCYALSRLSPALIVITPLKRPQIRPAWGWILVDELLHERVRARLYAAR
jgi:2-polyprenyl-3-methyl-5-hydroxy-6-metoxy-1,4-benzoquinol methylase